MQNSELSNNSDLKVTPEATNSIQYKGTINVTVKKGNRIITKKTYHNKGTRYLFEYLCNCLTTDSPNTNKAPVAIRFYNNTEAAQDVTNAAINENSTPLSDYIYYARREVTTEDDNYNAHLEFTISCSYIKSSESGASGFVDINQIGLYSAEHADSSGLDTNKTNYSAVFNFADSSGEWEPVTVHAQSGDYNIFVDWILSFGNSGGLI